MYPVCWVVAAALILANLVFGCAISWWIVAGFFFFPIIFTIVLAIFFGVVAEIIDARVARKYRRR